jgi:DNA polymerase-4
MVKVRFADFHTITRARTVASPVDSGPAVAVTALELLEQIDPSPGVRLLGVSVSNLAPEPAHQLSFDETGPSWSEASLAVDEIRRRYGHGAVGPASLAGGQGLRVKRQGDQQWGPAGG